MRTRYLCCALLALLLVWLPPAGAHAATGLAAAGTERYDRAFAEIVSRWGIPGGALAVVEHGEVVLARGYGLADVERGDPVQPDSLFRIASLSKPLTAAAVLTLVEAGAVSLDARAFRILGDLEPPPGQRVDPRLYDVTIRHLLEHAGGWDAGATFDPMFETQRAAQALALTAPAGCEDVIRYMLGQPLDHDPGTRYAYSNLGYCVLGRVIEAVSGESYEAYVQRAVLAPVGIRDMRLGRSRLADRQPGEVRYYDHAGAPLAASVYPDGPERVPWPYGGFHLEAMDAHGGWIGSAQDLARFVAALDGTGPTPLLAPSTLEAMLARPAPPLWEGRSDWYALGWRVRPAGQDATWWHTGSIPGSTAVAYRSAGGLAWVALLNSRPSLEQVDDLQVELITAMGRAATLTRLAPLAPLALVVPAGAGLAIALVVRRRRARRAHVTLGESRAPR